MATHLSDSARAFLARPLYAVLATTGADGAPATSVVWYGLDGDDIVVSSQEGRLKVRNARLRPAVSLCVYDPEDPQRYVEVRGAALVSEDEERATAVRLAERYAGPGAGENFLRQPPEDLRVVLRITPERITGNAR
ncbi:PPOX class F420-dependent oxidoreductase [Streptomyces sp. NRRL F-5630]|uniref:PPOX class F420-dependent oxidoreductase n=1 Tax=Streptomyces sp. NRRL F-5630 TaxID=1463864 RepID=UPI003EBA545C